MKGQLWDIMVVILTLGFMIFLVNIAFGSVAESIGIDAEINSEKIAGIINILQASPTKTTQTYFMPEGECSIDIRTYGGLSIINFTETSFEVQRSAVKEPIMTEIVIDDFTAQCAEDEKKVYFQRCFDRIKISEQEVTCP